MKRQEAYIFKLQPFLFVIYPSWFVEIFCCVAAVTSQSQWTDHFIYASFLPFASLMLQKFFFPQISENIFPQSPPVLLISELAFLISLRIYFAFKVRKKKWPSFPYCPSCWPVIPNIHKSVFPALFWLSCHSLSAGDLNLSLCPTISYTLSWTWKPETVAACGWISLGLSTPRNPCFFLSL